MILITTIAAIEAIYIFFLIRQQMQMSKDLDQYIQDIANISTKNANLLNNAQTQKSLIVSIELELTEKNEYIEYCNRKAEQLLRENILFRREINRLTKENSRSSAKLKMYSSIYGSKIKDNDQAEEGGKEWQKKSELNMNMNVRSAEKNSNQSDLLE